MDPPTYPFEETFFMDGPLHKRKVFFYELWNFKTNLPIEWHIKHAFLATRFDKDLIFAEMLSH